MVNDDNNNNNHATFFTGATREGVKDEGEK